MNFSLLQIKEMAEKPEDQFSSEEKIAKAKELYGRGCRNYYVKSYSEAADDLSEASKLFAEELGVDADELGDVYLLYAKALIAIGQEENKLIDVPEEDEDEEDDVEEDGEEEVKEGATNGEQNGEAVITNGHSEEPQAGPSGANGNESSNDVPEENEEAEDGGDLETAWEVLLNAAAIFERQGAKGLSKLMDTYIEMGGISLENGNFEVAIKDFTRALDVFIDLEEIDQNQRIAAEINYKIGLCQSMIKQYEDSVKSFKNAVELLDEVLEKEKARENQTQDVLDTIKDIQETQQEILNKIAEIGETEAEEVEEVKKELAKLFGTGTEANGSSDGAGTSSSSAAKAEKSPEAQKPKPTDISHLIKRKKPDTESVDESPAKKKAIETSPGEKVPVAVHVSPEAKVPEDSSETVQVANE